MMFFIITFVRTPNPIQKYTKDFLKKSLLKVLLNYQAALPLALPIAYTSCLKLIAVEAHTLKRQIAWLNLLLHVRKCLHAAYNYKCTDIFLYLRHKFHVIRCVAFPNWNGKAVKTPPHYKLSPLLCMDYAVNSARNWLVRSHTSVVAETVVSIMSVPEAS
jgi:hypothetical protein